MSVLVTGATGFVGSAVARRLLAEGLSVRVLVRPQSDRRNLEGLDVEMANGDVRDPMSLELALRGCDALFHLAADYRLWARRPQDLLDTNVTGTENLMRAAAKAGVERIVYTSSVAALGLRGDGSPADEETPVALADMIGTYERSKYLAEETVRTLAASEGLPVVIVNPSTPIGPRDIKPSPTGRIIVEVARGRMPAVVESGLNIVHVDDVAEGHLLAFHKGQVSERYILGGHDMTLREIAARVAAIAGRRAPRFRVPHALAMPIAFASEAAARLTGRIPFATLDGVRMARRTMFFSSAKAERDLGYRARPAEDAFRDAVDWFAENGYLR